MPLTAEALNDEALNDETMPRTALTDEARHSAAPGTGRDVPAARKDVTSPSSVPAQEYSNGHCVATAATAFFAVFLVTGFFVGTVRGYGWTSSISLAITLGVVGAGLQLLLLAVRHRRELEADGDA